MTATGHHEGDARSLVTTLLHSLRTHYRGQVVTDSLNQGLKDFARGTRGNSSTSSTTKYVITLLPKLTSTNAIGHHEGDARSLEIALLHSLRTHYRGQVVTDSLNQGLKDFARGTRGNSSTSSTTKYVIRLFSFPAWTRFDERYWVSRGRRKVPRDYAAALPPHALPWSGVDGISQPGAE
jgi:hypothetical protein